MEKVCITTKVFILIFTFVLTGCTPYDSDKVNTGLIQGKWMLVEADRAIYDSVEVNYTKELTVLIFEGNRCRQYMSDWKDTIEFRYAIHNYELELYKDSMPFRKLIIATLAPDSMILSFKEDSWKYKKIEQ